MKYNNKDDIEKWLKKMNLTEYVINSDLSVDYTGLNLNISSKNLTEIPIVFGKVLGNFDCSKNKLKSLEGCPLEVEGSFDASQNKLEDIRWFPKIVDGSINLSYNNLKSLDYLPNKINSLICNYNKLSSLKKFPKEINGNLILRFNEIEDLSFLPSIVDGVIDVYGNDIKYFNGKLKDIKKEIILSSKKVDNYDNVAEDRLTFTVAQFNNYILYKNYQAMELEQKTDKKKLKI